MLSHTAGTTLRSVTGSVSILSDKELTERFSQSSLRVSLALFKIRRPMFGIILATLAGVLFTLADAGKKLLSEVLHPEALIHSTLTLGLIVNGAYLLATGVPYIAWDTVWLPLVVCAFLVTFGELAFVHGIRATDLSLAKPLTALFPLFVAILSFLIFGEKPNWIGALGIGTIIVGAYLLGLQAPLRSNMFAPFTRLVSDQGSRMMILATLIGAIVMVTQKLGASGCSPVVFLTLVWAINWFIFLLLALKRGVVRAGHSVTPRIALLLLLSGLAWGSAGALTYLSFHYTAAAYAGSALQIQVFLSILVGGVAFKEQAIKQRIVAGTVMVAGIVIISLCA